MQLETIDLRPLAWLPTWMDALDRAREQRLESVLYICNRLVHGCIIKRGSGLVKGMCVVGRSLVLMWYERQ